MRGLITYDGHEKKKYLRQQICKKHTSETNENVTSTFISSSPPTASCGLTFVTSIIPILAIDSSVSMASKVDDALDEVVGKDEIGDGDELLVDRNISVECNSMKSSDGFSETNTAFRVVDIGIKGESDA